jgi:hypothetical protein
MKRATIYLEPELEVLLKLEVLRQRGPKVKAARVPHESELRIRTDLTRHRFSVISITLVLEK